MAPSYTITIQNDSGAPHSYNITQEAPPVDGLSGRPWPLVINKARVPAGASAEFSIEIPNPYYAYALSSQGQPGHGTSAQVISKVPVNLGKSKDGDVVPGSTIKYVVNEGTPTLMDTRQPNAPNSCFSVVTGGDFRDSDAKRDNYLLGYGSRDKAWSAFSPSPNMQYRIYPKGIFYVFSSDLREGQIVNIQSVGQALKIDLDAMQKSSIKIKHNGQGELVIEK